MWWGNGSMVGHSCCHHTRLRLPHTRTNSEHTSARRPSIQGPHYYYFGRRVCGMEGSVGFDQKPAGACVCFGCKLLQYIHRKTRPTLFPFSPKWDVKLKKLYLQYVEVYIFWRLHSKTIDSSVLLGNTHSSKTDKSFYFGYFGNLYQPLTTMFLCHCSS